MDLELIHWHPTNEPGDHNAMQMVIAWWRAQTTTPLTTSLPHEHIFETCQELETQLFLFGRGVGDVSRLALPVAQLLSLVVTNIEIATPQVRQGLDYLFDNFSTLEPQDIHMPGGIALFMTTKAIEMLANQSGNHLYIEHPILNQAKVAFDLAQDGHRRTLRSAVERSFKTKDYDAARRAALDFQATGIRPTRSDDDKLGTLMYELALKTKPNSLAAAYIRIVSERWTTWMPEEGKDHSYFSKSLEQLELRPGRRRQE